MAAYSLITIRISQPLFKFGVTSVMGSEVAVEDIIHEVYPGGNTLLLCGPSQVKLLVHSIFLTNMSKVFGAMLSPNFREGQLHTNGGPREIPLPEDDPFAMLIICNIAHSRSVPDTISPTQLLAIAYAADKYDVVPILKFASARWISPTTRTPPHEFNIEDIGSKMTAAYILQDSESFQKTTAEIVMEYDKSFRRLEPLLGDIMPADIIRAFFFFSDSSGFAKRSSQSPWKRSAIGSAWMSCTYCGHDPPTAS